MPLFIVDAGLTGALHAGKALTKLIFAYQKNGRSATKQDTEPPQIMLKTPPTKLQRIFSAYQSEQFKGGSVASHEQYTKVVAKVKTKECNRYTSACAASTSGVQQFVQEWRSHWASSSRLIRSTFVITWASKLDLACSGNSLIIAVQLVIYADQYMMLSEIGCNPQHSHLLIGSLFKMVIDCHCPWIVPKFKVVWWKVVMLEMLESTSDMDSSKMVLFVRYQEQVVVLLQSDPVHWIVTQHTNPSFTHGMAFADLTSVQTAAYKKLFYWLFDGASHNGVWWSPFHQPNCLLDDVPHICLFNSCSNWHWPPKHTTYGFLAAHLDPHQGVVHSIFPSMPKTHLLAHQDHKFRTQEGADPWHFKCLLWPMLLW